MDKKVTIEEYERLVRICEFNDTMRNNLLSFSFTSVLAILGVALAIEENEVSVWIYLIPFFLIIPFSARIVYYRLSSVHIKSFLKRFAPEYMKFEIGVNEVNEKKFFLYPIVARLVNHEMVMLAAATSFVFYFKLIRNITTWTFKSYLCLLVPIILTLIVFFISNSTFNYYKLMKKFDKEWEKYYNSI